MYLVFGWLMIQRGSGGQSSAIIRHVSSQHFTRPQGQVDDPGPELMLEQGAEDFENEFAAQVM